MIAVFIIVLVSVGQGRAHTVNDVIESFESKFRGAREARSLRSGVEAFQD